MVGVPLLAQVFLPARKITPSLPSSSSDPTNLLPAGLALWWHDEDLSSSPVSVWTDRIKGYNWTQGTVANQPTWSTNGVSFDGSNDSLVATNMLPFQPGEVGDHAWLVIFGFDTIHANELVLANTNNGGEMLVAMTTTNYFYTGTGGDTSIGLIKGGWMDLFMGLTTNASNPHRVYTNGIQGYENVAGWGASGGFGYVGAGGTANYFDGLIKEVLVWSNVTFTAAQISNVHQYAISRYTNNYVPTTAVFDGSSDYLAVTNSAPSGLADGKTFTFSGWFKKMGGDGVAQVLFAIGDETGSTRLGVNITSGNLIQLAARNAADAIILNLSGDSTITAAKGWLHFYACIDMANTSNRKIYVNGREEVLSVTTYTDDTIDLVGTDYRYVVATSSGVGASLYTGAAAEIWWNDSYLDSVSSFYKAPAQPQNLGSDGSTPTGSQPVFYLKGSGNAFNVNSGTGGNYVTIGSLDTIFPP